MSSITRDRPKFLWIGDSLTEFGDNATQPGWLNLMAWNYTRRADMQNRGFVSYTTREVVQIVDELTKPAEAVRTKLAAVWLGANDAKQCKWLAARNWSDIYVSPAEYAANLRTMVTTIRKAGIEMVMLITPPPVIEEFEMPFVTPGGQSILPRTNANTQLYTDAALQLGKDIGVPVVNMRTALEALPGFGKDFYRDALHFNTQGQKAAFNILRQAIAENFPQLKSSALPEHWPPTPAPKQTVSRTCMDAVKWKGVIQG